MSWIHFQDIKALKVKEMRTVIKQALSICLLLALGIIAEAQQPTVIGCGALPAGSPVTPYLIGQNYWFFPPDSAYPTVIKNSGVTIVRIGGHRFDETLPLTDAEVLHQVDLIRSIGAEPIYSSFAIWRVDHCGQHRAIH